MKVKERLKARLLPHPESDVVFVAYLLIFLRLDKGHLIFLREVAGIVSAGGKHLSTLLRLLFSNHVEVSSWGLLYVAA